MNIRRKILVPAISLGIFLAAIAITVNVVQFSKYVDSDLRENVTNALYGGVGIIEDMKPAVTNASLYMSEDEQLIEAFEIRDDQALFERAIELQQLTTTDACIMVDTSGIVIARTHAPDVKNDSLIDKPSVMSALLGNPVTYVEEGNPETARLLIVCARPVYGVNEEILGAIVVGYRLDTNSFVDSIKKKFKCETSIVVNKERISTTILNDDDSRAVGSRVEIDFENDSKKEIVEEDSWQIFGHRLYMGAIPIRNIDEKIVGILVVAIYNENATVTIQRFIFVTVGIIAVTLILFSVLLFFFVVKGIATPISIMTNAVTGMIPQEIIGKSYVKGSDEIKYLSNIFDTMIKRTRIRMFEDDQQLTRLSRLVDNAPQYIAYVNPEGQFSFVNAATRKITGYEKEELYANGLSILYSDETNKRINEEILPNIFKLGNYEFEIPLIRKDGQVRIMSFSGFALNESLGMACGTIATDITEKKILEDDLKIAKETAEKANISKSQFLANMSHEIRTPMNTIISMTEFLMDEKLSKHQYDYLDDIKTAGTTLLNIINEILDFSKIESHSFEISPIHFDFSVMLSNLQSTFSFIANEKNLQFIYKAAISLPKYLYADDIRLRQILTNVLSNAIKFTRYGSVTLNIWADTKKIYFDVIDTGIGIRKEQITEVFSSFRQLEKEANRHISGTGLGLPIAKELIELMGGSISVESEYGEGCTFHLAISRVDGDPQKIINEDKSNHDFFRAPLAKVLVVDDYEPNLRIVRGLLGIVAIKCDIAQSGEAAISMFDENHNYDLIFMDHMMPVMDGVETTKRIREKGFTNIPIIALTANAIKGAKEQLIANGMDDYLSKPINRRLFMDILLKWLPPEKVIFMSQAKKNSSSKAIASGGELRQIQKIKTIDLESALALLGDDQGIYLDALKSFSKRVAEDIEQMKAYLASQAYDKFVIAIHSLKSSLATAGATKLAKDAGEIEGYAKEKDFAFCNKKFSAFSRKVLLLHSQLKLIFGLENEEKFAKDDIPSCLQKVFACLEKLDDITALDILKTIEKMKFDKKQEISKLRRHIELFEYDEAKNILKILLENMQ